MTKTAMLAFLDRDVEARRQSWRATPNALTRGRLRAEAEALMGIRDAIEKHVPSDPASAEQASLFNSRG